MLQINCPSCGLRDEDEFRCGGQSHVTRPALSCTDAEWSDYLFNKDNPKGVHFERWLHVFGCNRWFNLARDTVTHAVLAAYGMGDARPVLTPAVVRERGNAVEEAVASRDSRQLGAGAEARS